MRVLLDHPAHSFALKLYLSIIQPVLFLFLFNGYILFCALGISNTLTYLLSSSVDFFSEAFLWAFLEVFWRFIVVICLVAYLVSDFCI